MVDELHDVLQSAFGGVAASARNAAARHVPEDDDVVLEQVGRRGDQALFRVAVQRRALDVNAAAGQMGHADEVHQRVHFQHPLDELVLEARKALQQQDVDLLFDHLHREADAVVRGRGVALRQGERVNVLALLLGPMAFLEATVRLGGHRKRADYLAVFLEGDGLITSAWAIDLAARPRVLRPGG